MSVLSASLLHLQTEVLETIARGESLASTFGLLCRRAEAMAPGTTCTILAIEAPGILHTLASPGLPASFSKAINGRPIGPKVGSCGTAAWRNEPVLVTDIEHDPLWEDYKALAIPLGLKACWSTPIPNRDGGVAATFAFYFKEARGPTELERRIVQTSVHLCSIAIEHEDAQATNYRLAYFDTLTGVPNRLHFNGLLQQQIAGGTPFGLLLADIDQLKIVNDTMGHAAGDAVIRTIAERIHASDPALTTCRLAGDEFAIIVPACTSASALEATAGKVLSTVNGLILAAGYSVEPHITMGGALFDAATQDADTLCQNADFALYHAKATNRGGYVPFTRELRTAIVNRINVVRDVGQAIADERMLPYYQPIVRLDTREIVGLEALARMRRPDGSIASAAEFHEAFSDPRIAYQLTGQMLTQIAKDIRLWLDAGIHFQHVGINVTTGDFERGDLEERLVHTFSALGVPLRHVLLEVNEAVFVGGSDNRIPKSVDALRKRGLLVALDDFGTGFASLTHLLSFPVDVIKIDKSFVDRLTTSAPSSVIVGAILDIARKLDMRVVAEGVETDEQVEKLRELGCILGQGYLFGRPCSEAETTALLQKFAQKSPEAVGTQRTA
ncbi:MAG: diguanylate cyclase [Devosia sp.]|uniref:putative bifunctional diguanylate cyclase/phosphodiesterase n=1 Tax=Devosia sp. TaxID=1871048 RepID=UPI00262F20B9|nr:EAL domain-containing protein [Devosia sp.]MDB5587220.1 diguanylate cyclase [Devosia sp.]